MSSNVHIEKALVDDAAVLRELRLELVRENPHLFGETFESEAEKDLEYYKKWIEKYSVECAAMFILFVDDKAVGMCVVRKAGVGDGSSYKEETTSDPFTGYFGSLGVLKKYQGMGYGKILMNHRLDWVRSNTNFKKIRTIVTKENIKMLKIVEEQGFKIVGEGEYHGVSEFYLEKVL